MNLIIKIIGTFFFSGFFPIAPATFASFVFMIAYAFVPGGEWLVHPVVVAVTLVVSVPVSTRLEKIYGHDAGKIVIDEVVGVQLILIGASPTLTGLVVAFFLWRLFDIVKPFPARRSQNLPRGWGVVADDFIAGIYTRLVLIVAALFVPVIGEFL